MEKMTDKFVFDTGKSVAVLLILNKYATSFIFMLTVGYIAPLFCWLF